MPFSVQILDSAKEDIIENSLYVMEKWGQDKAEESYTSIIEKLDLLATQPKMGLLVPELVALGILNYYIYVHESHTKFLYEIDEQKEVITVHMVYGSNQDFQTLLYRRIIRYI
jgi:plasmid stabilization system protein ParE